MANTKMHIRSEEILQIGRILPENHYKLYPNSCASYKMYEEGRVSVDYNKIEVIWRIEEESNITTNIGITIF